MHLQRGVTWLRLASVLLASLMIVSNVKAQGRVEIFSDGVWFSVCHTYVTQPFGSVVCRQIGYPALSSDGAVLYYANSYGTAPGEILKKRINCNGAETSLTTCSFSLNNQNCDPRYTLGVSCYTDRIVRLVNGTTPYEGRVEVLKSGVWGTIIQSEDVYGVITANIVCQNVFGSSYGGSFVPRQEATLRFGVASRRAIQMINVRCEGNEQSLLNCSYSTAGPSETLENSFAVVCKKVPNGCNGIFATSNGTVTSPGFPQGAVYESDADCVWTIGNKVSRIQLNFTDLQINTTLSSAANILHVFDGSTRLLASIQGTTTVNTLQSYGSTLHLWLKAQAGTKGIQFNATWDEYVPPTLPTPPTPPPTPCGGYYSSSSDFMLSEGYPNQYKPNQDCNYTIIKRKGVWISFSFSEFALGEQQRNLCQDSLQIFDGDSFSSPTIGGPLCGTTLPSVLKTRNQTSTTVLVRFISDAVNTSAENRFKVYYSQVEPDPIRPGNYTEDNGTFSTPGYPNVYNDEEDVIWTITTKPYKIITLSFSAQNPELYNSLNVQNSYDTISRSGSDWTIRSRSNSLEVILRSTLDNGVNSFMATWTTECWLEYTNFPGIITPPNDPEFNKSSSDCTFIVRERQPGYYINIQFSSISFEKDLRCRNYIEIHDGNTPYFPVLGEKYCGLSLPPSLNSTQNALFIKFGTQRGLNSFSLTYSSHPKECSKSLMTDSEGSFTSPGFPLGYPSNTYCVWTIRVDDKEAVIDLTFDDFSVGSRGTQCENAFVRVYDGPVVDPKSVMSDLCGTTITSRLRSTGSSLTVVLNVFGSLVNANGFRATYIARRQDGELPKGFFPYGVSLNDKKLGTLTDETLTIPFEDGFPFGENGKEFASVGTNGIVSFQKGTAWPWFNSSQHVICVYCSYINNQKGVYYHLYDDATRDSAVLDKATYDVQDFTGSKTFKASMVLVVTWDRVNQYFPSVDYKPSNMGDATFQVALVTDWSISYALVQYRVGHMTWRYPGRWHTIQMGVAKGSLTTFRPNVYSASEFAYEIDNYYGNTGYKGYWVYELGKIPANYSKVCKDWFRRNKDLKHQRSSGFAALPMCPCSRRDIFRIVVNQWRFHRRDEQNHFECFILNLARTGQFAPFGKECCYSTNALKPDTLDMLITSPPYAGAALAFNPLVFAQEKLYDSEDRIPHVACCEHGTNKQCRRYYNLRPIGKCDPNPGFQWGPLYGDPHITTFDERQYLSNGLGEFTLVKMQTSNVSFTLQARTQRAELRPGTPTNGTVFTAVGAEENGVRVFLQIDPNTNNTLIIYVKGVDYTTRFEQEGDDFSLDDGRVMLNRDNDTCVVSFSSGISLQIYIRMKALVIGIAMPRNFRNLTNGLLGNFNGDQTDDFILPSGERLNNSLTERQIFNLFAKQWLVNANNSVMRYEARMGPADFYRQDFEPLFLDEVNPSQLTQAKVLCGDTNMPCIYDFLATGDRNFAFQTSDLRTLSDILIQQSKNTAPVLQVPDVIYVTVGVPTVFVVTGVDPDVTDKLTYRLVDDASGTLSINQSSGAVSVNPASSNPFKIQVYVVDSQGAQSPVESVPIVACSGCSGHGTCNMSDTRDFAVCQCGPAWAGDNCELDRDGCSDSPCHPLRPCTDIPASQQGSSDIGYVCSPCPQGYFSKNDSKDCYDVDECLIGTLHGCDMICTNTYGSYECSCQEGYRLSTNGHSCDDVNECVERTHDCQQICVNTAGGFRCECEAGYTYDSTSKSCIINANVSQICRNNTCSQGCRVITDAGNNKLPQCFCYQGFDLDIGDNVTCVDHDECRDKVCAQVCQNSVGGFSCSCYDGYTISKDGHTCSACSYLKYGPECRETCTCSGRSVACHPVRGCVCQDGWNGTTCADDVDECAENPDVCGLDQTCVNSKGSYSCVCRSGFAVDDKGVCQDIDECAADIPCKENEECTNIPGDYYCSCKQGYSKANSTNCTDVDECSANRGDCQHDCVNVLGSFNCECKYGYRLNADRKTCSQVREVCVNAAKCSQAHGCTLDDSNTDLCFCNNGHTIDLNTQSCKDTDECLTGLARCSHNCTNTPGSFVCSCPVGMKLDNTGLTCSACPPGTFGPNCTQVCACSARAEGCDAVSGCVCRQGWEGVKCEKDVDECQSQTSPANCTGQHLQCVNTYGGYTCECRQGFAADNDSLCQDIDECSEQVCEQHCNNTIGSFHCTCDDGFYLDTINQTCLETSTEASTPLATDSSSQPSDYTALATDDDNNTATANYTTVSADINNITATENFTALSTDINNTTATENYTTLSTDINNITAADNYTALSMDINNSTATAELSSGQIAGIVVGTVGGVAACGTAVVMIILKLKGKLVVGVHPAA